MLQAEIDALKHLQAETAAALDALLPRCIGSPLQGGIITICGTIGNPPFLRVFR
jgi:hypothetical protein